MHEASLHDENCFVTLTVDPEHMTPGGSLDRQAFPLFMKRLRRRIAPQKVRVFYCGEYGAECGRPHYHACLFGWFPTDAVRAGSRGDHAVYRSADLSALWPDGFSEVGTVTFDSAAYVARYVTKKVRGEAAAEHYLRVDPESGELFCLEPEFAQMSRRPGIGAGWFDRFGGELEQDGTVIESGKEVPMPRYYRKLMNGSSPEAARRLCRLSEIRRFVGEPRMVGEYLERVEKLQKARLTLGGRSLE